jgi:hypothetical protein
VEIRYANPVAEALAVLFCDLPCGFLAAVLIDWSDPGHRLDARRLHARFPRREEAPRLPFGFP